MTMKFIPYFLSLSFLVASIILFRMKGLELDYRYFKTQNKIEKVLYKKKELVAQKAKLLSLKRLNKLVKKYNLIYPGEKRILVIP